MAKTPSTNAQGETGPPQPPRTAGATTAPAPGAEVAASFFDNTGSPTILITEDKLRLALAKYADGLTGLGWVPPLGIFVPIVAALESFSNFDGTRLGLGSHTWHTVFVVAAIISGAWLLLALIKRVAKGGRQKSVDACVTEIKGENTKQLPRVGR
jgi:hypothetical protein